jgi:hypothetical protein
VKWWQFLLPSWAAQAAARKTLGTDRVNRFIPAIHKVARAKLNGPLRQVLFTVKIQAETSERAHALISMLTPALACFERDGFNYLVPADDRSYPLILSPSEVGALWHLPNEQCRTPQIIWAKGRHAPAPISIVRNQDGVLLGESVQLGRTAQVRIPYADRVTHAFVNGKTGVGKSTLLHHLIHQDIANGKGLALFDPHGALVQNILRTSVPVERERDVVVLDFWQTEHPPPLNPFSLPDGVPRDVISSQIMGVLKKLFADQWSRTRMETAIYSALVALLDEPQATPRDIPRLFIDPAFRQRLLRQVTDPVALEYWHDEFEQHSRGVQRQVAEPVLSRMRIFYRNASVRNMVCHPFQLDIGEIIRRRRILLISLASDHARTEQHNLAAMLLATIQMTAMGRRATAAGARTEFYLYIDEVQEFLTTSLPEALSQMRKFGLSLTACTQFLGQLRGALLESILGNVGTAVLFACGPNDARALAPVVEPALTPDDLVNLDRFTAAVKMQLSGRTMSSFTVSASPPLAIPEDAHEREQRIRQYSIDQYTPWTRAEVETWLEQRYPRPGTTDPTNIEDDDIPLWGS